MTGPGPEVDYAVAAPVPRSTRRRGADRKPARLWGGRGRTALKAGCWVGAALLALPLLVPLLVGDETGADSPEEAVAQLLQGIADVDPVAMVAVVDPDEADDPARAQAAYDRLGSRLLRRGEDAPLDVTAVLLATESQLGGEVDRTSLAILAAVDLDLEGLELQRSASDGGEVPVSITDGVLGVSIDPERLPDDVGNLGRASYDMPLAQGWIVDEFPVAPSLVTVQHDGRWYVSLEATADELLGTTRGS